LPIIPANWELPKTLQPQPAAYAYDLDRALSSVFSLSARIPDEAFTASLLGTERLGNGVLIREDGVVLTIGYLITEAEAVTLTTWDGRDVAGHVLGFDYATGFGLVQALEPLDLPALRVGAGPVVGDKVVIAAGGGRGRALRAQVEARQEFAGYWEYLMEDAIFTSPAHPLWSGAAMIGASGDLIGVGSLHLEQARDKGDPLPLNMSVPAELLTPIFDDLVSGRAPGPVRPWLGLLLQQIGASVVTVGVVDGAPASRAEIRPGDVILAVADTRVSSLAEFYRRLWALGPAGADVPLTLMRGSDVFDLEVRSVDRDRLLWKPRFN
jgi:S1-C subfamily serine protease